MDHRGALELLKTVGSPPWAMDDTSLSGRMNHCGHSLDRLDLDSMLRKKEQ